MLINYSINDCTLLSLFAICQTAVHSPRVYVYNTVLASHIDTTDLVDGTYELIPESVESDPEVQVNGAILTEDPDQSLEEPKAILASDYREGKPRT